MGTKVDSKRVRRYVRARGDCRFITNAVMAADAVIGVPLPFLCYTDEMKTLVDAIEALRAHTADIERYKRSIKDIEDIERSERIDKGIAMARAALAAKKVGK